MVALKLVPSPEKLCRDMIEELSSSDHQTSTSSSTTDMKKLMFTLQYAVREQEYYSVFLKLEGLAHLARIILESQGNTLAYALTALSNIMDHDYGWDQFSPEFIGNIVSIISSAHQRANICRPATSVVTKFISSNTNIKSYGFDCVYDQIKRHPEFLKSMKGVWREK